MMRKSEVIEKEMKLFDVDGIKEMGSMNLVMINSILTLIGL
jgi:hypothetical protein